MIAALVLLWACCPIPPEPARTPTGYCVGEAPPHVEEGIAEVPEGAEIESVTVYGVEPLTGQDYRATSWELPESYWTRAGGLVAVDCPETGGRWSWRSFVVSYWPSDEE